MKQKVTLACNIVIALCVLFALFSSIGCTVPYSEGQRTGNVVKFSLKGIIWKTWEGELQLGGAAAISPENNFQFTVEEMAMVNEIREALHANKTVTLHYEQYFITPPWKGETNYFIKGVASSE